MGGQLVLPRHGESTANAAGTFTGLLNALLTDRGEHQARAAGRLLRAHGIVPNWIITSTLHRARRTAELVSEVLGREAPTDAWWELNERNYGALTGATKTTARAQLGDAAYMRLRRSVDGRPAPMPLHTWWTLRTSPTLRHAPTAAIRRTETLRDVIDRTGPVLVARVLPAVRAGATVLVVAHGNSLRAVCTHIDHLSDAEVADLNLPTGQPLRYRITPTGALAPRGGEYLDPEALDAAALVAAEGGT
ncbi:2,3-bisphosphoglycerate-dependent phosphoglycerate mutase [Curtobacterium luteum]|uniref:2,3-bisphosphoglycerate-dependent phosphoglycerate mutase n=1 Tax=Curtobacterium luteum TaxID=33881 RepID=A0A175S1R1_9MICO|nr:2,3-diphosphoglycerate-dependent phosphoglycerate mutase [Curtobacterium luteum]KTR10387.1 phosphoglycerate mutase [Curtobacterium luteum]